MANRMTAVADLLQKGRQFVVLCLGGEKLKVGIAGDEVPEEFPHVIAYRLESGTQTNSRTPELTQEERNAREVAYQEAWKALGLTGNASEAVMTARDVDGMHEDEPCRDSVLTGDAVCALQSSGPYKIVYPLKMAGLDPNRSSWQLRSDLSIIWTSAVESVLKLQQSEIQEYGVVLIVPDSVGLGDIEIMVRVLLEDMMFKEVVVHADSTAAMFGQGISGGCIVHVDDASTRVSCIEDGVLVAGSLKLLPFGGHHIGNALSWMLRSKIPSDFSQRQRYGSRMAQIRDDVCFLPGEGPESALETQIRNLPSVQIQDDKYNTVEMHVGVEACLAPMGLFFPHLLIPHAPCFPHTLKCASEAFYSQILSDTENSKTSNGSRLDCLKASLDAAIVQSISAAESVEHRRRLYTNILIVGACSHLTGLADMVERRVLSALPSDELIDTVAVLEPKWPSKDLIWKGGMVLGLLSDHWVKRDEWVNCGKPNKLGKRDIPQSKVYWMFKTEIGLM